ncbi:MAG: hypothetical protein KJN66_10565, partial [Bacteroidia bacterium]|nr:hypothetical protein [Bacteroidia bacterium]
MNFKASILQYTGFILFFILQSSYLIAQTDKSATTAIDDINAQYHTKAIGVTKDGIIEGMESLSSYLNELQSDYGAPQNFKSHIV